VNPNNRVRELESCIRQDRRAIFTARVKLALLWLPAVVGLSWARERTLDQREISAHAEYSIEEDADNLRRLRVYGTELVGFLLRLPDEGNGYDGWLRPEDCYLDQGSEGP
jgi:hypothetical protein